MVVFGSRGFEGHVRIKKTGKIVLAYDLMKYVLDKRYEGRDVLFVNGGAKGADTLSDKYAKASGRESKLFKAPWETMGDKAGLYRNTLMANFADEGVAFWDGKSTGTMDTIKKLESKKKLVHVVTGWRPLDYEPVVTGKPVASKRVIKG